MTKKLIALLMAMAMVFALAACGDSDTQTETTDDAATSAYTDDESYADDESYFDDESYVDDESYIEDESAEASAQAEGSSVLGAELDEKKEALLQIFTMAAQGKGTDGFDYYLVYNDDVSKACLMKADHDNEQCVDVSGDVTQDGEWLTITDNTYGYSFSFALKDETDSGITMVTTNDVDVEMEFVDIDRALTNILGFENSYTIVDPTK